MSNAVWHGADRSLVIKDLVYEAKAKAKTFLKAKDIKNFQDQHQGQLRQLSLWAKICIAVTETEYADFLKQCKGNDLWRFWCSIFKLTYKNKVLPEPYDLTVQR